jgi:hypothetical protein
LAIVRFSDPLLKLDLQRLAADQPLERRDPRLVFAQQLGQRHDLSRNLIRIWVENAEAGSLDRDMASAECVQRLPGVALGNDLTLEVDAVTVVSGHGLSSSESPPPVNRDPPYLFNPRGALHVLSLGCPASAPEPRWVSRARRSTRRWCATTRAAPSSINSATSC